MRTVPLSDTGVQVSQMCLGAMHFGTRTPAEVAFELLDAYVAAGGSFIDTANIYGTTEDEFGLSETTIGAWLASRRNRDEMFIASKVGFPYRGDPGGLRRRQIEAECEKSLLRLGIETIDLYYAHCEDRSTPLEETMEAFDRLVRAGKVRYLGVSNHAAWRIEEARWISRTNGWAGWCCLQQRHSYLRWNHDTLLCDPGRQRLATPEVLDYCRTRGMTLIAYAPLIKGVYVKPDMPMDDRYVGADTQARLAALSEVVNETGAKANQVVLAWLMQSDPPAIPLFGVSSVDQLRENLAALDLKLTDEQMTRLTRAHA